MTLQNILAAGRAVLPLLPMGDHAVTAGKAIAALIDANRGSLSTTDAEVAELNATRDALEAAVNAHADRTLGSLG